MNNLVFSVYDSAAGLFLQPFVAQTIEVAIREFRAACNTPQHQFAKYPEDYTLFHVGEFNAETGLLTPLTAPHTLGVAISYIDAPSPLQAPENR